MTEILRQMVVRPAKPAAAARSKKHGLQLYVAPFQSARFREWQALARKSNFQELQGAFQHFLLSKEATLSLDMLKGITHDLLRSCEASGWNMRLQEFMRLLPASPAERKEVGQTLKGDFMAVQDTLLAVALVREAPQPEWDLSRGLQAINLALTLLDTEKVPRSLVPKVSLDRVFGNAVVFPNDFLPLDPCAQLPVQGTAWLNAADPNAPKDSEKKCSCEENKDDPCDCSCDDRCVSQSKCCGEIKLYAGELFVVEDEIECYHAGELSYIENVLESEIRIRKHRHLRREELVIESEEESDSYEERDLQIDDRYALKKEVESVIALSQSVESGGSIKYGGDGLPFKFSAYSDISFSADASLTQKMVRDESRQVIDKAISRLQLRMKNRAVKTMLSEIEEKNQHIFGGTTGATQDIVGMYHHVNASRKAQVFSHGARMMMDLYLPEPAEMLKRLLDKGFGREEPAKCCIDVEDISPDRYLDYVQCHGLTDLEAPPQKPPVKFIHKTYDEKSSDMNVVIPSGYKVTEIRLVNVVHKKTMPGFFSRVTFHFGGGKVEQTSSWSNSVGGNTVDTISPTGTANGSIDKVNTKNFTFTVRFKLVPDPVDLLPWKLTVHHMLMEKCEAEHLAYEEARAAHEAEQFARFSENPLALELQIREQLKHAAISFISCQFFDENDAMRHRVAPCGLPQMDLREATREGEFVRFFEQAFEWNFMSYMLYAYFWGRKCTWAEKLQENAQELFFEKFLQSGSARLTLSVRPGFEAYVAYFLSTGNIWGPTGVPPIAGTAFLPILTEIKESMQNYFADRDGELIWDSGFPGLGNDQVILRNNMDYRANVLGFPFDPALAAVDLNREVFINCNRYRIVAIHEDALTGEIILTLDRDFAEQKDFGWPWSTGAVFVGAAWRFVVPTNLIWLAKEKRCLPCFPVECTP